MIFVIVSCDITKNRGVQCKDKLGGLDIIYIFPYVKHTKNLIVRSELVLTSYPATFIYAFAIVSGVYSEDSEEDGGSSFMNQSLTSTMTYLNDDNQWKKLLDKDHCVIAKDRNGKFRLIGVYNGVRTEYKATTGNSHGDFNGWDFNFKGKEQDQALYFDDLEDVGFTIVGSGEGGNFVFQDDSNFVFQDDNNFILN